LKYDHRYHAGNFSDLLKHIVLQSVILYAQRKDTPVQIIDTHSGFGLYPLAELSAEAQYGVRAFLSLKAQWTSPLLIQYAQVIAPLWEQGVFPGSPLLAAMLKRESDPFWAFEKYEEPYSALQSNLQGFSKTYAKHAHGLLGLKGLLPPQSKRSIVLIDPAYERLEEYTELLQTLEWAFQIFPQGTYIIWYPHSKRAGVMNDILHLAGEWGDKVLRVDYACTQGDGEGLKGAGLCILNPPYSLKQHLEEAKADFQILGLELSLT